MIAISLHRHGREPSQGKEREKRPHEGSHEMSPRRRSHRDLVFVPRTSKAEK
jgi:hypothetical protein